MVLEVRSSLIATFFILFCFTIFVLTLCLFIRSFLNQPFS